LTFGILIFAFLEFLAPYCLATFAFVGSMATLNLFKIFWFFATFGVFLINCSRVPYPAVVFLFGWKITEACFYLSEGL